MQLVRKDDSALAESGEELWTSLLCPSAALPTSGSAAFELDGRRIAIFMIDGTHHAIDDYCTHGRSSLCEDGDVTGTIVTCGLHRAQFDVRTGQVQRGPTRTSLRSYSLITEGAMVRVTERAVVEKQRREMVGRL